MGIIEDLSHYVAGWIDWNLILNEGKKKSIRLLILIEFNIHFLPSIILNEEGGPSYINNTVDAAVILNSTTKNEFYKQPIFYVLAHFSKFIPPDSVRIYSKLNGFRARNIKTIAFLLPDNTVTVILYNHSDKLRIIDFTDDLRGSYEIQLEPRSIVTVVYV